MKERNWLWYLVIIVLLLLAYYLGTIISGPAQEPPTPELSTIAFSDPQQNDASLPELPEAWVSHGTYTNTELNQDFPVTVVGNSAEAVNAYTGSAKFFFEAKPSTNPPSQNLPTPSANPTLEIGPTPGASSTLAVVAPPLNAEAEFPLYFSSLNDMLTKYPDSLLIEIHLADESAKAFQAQRQDYDLNFIVDPTISAAARYHNYYTKFSRYSARATLQVHGTAGSSRALLYRKLSATQPWCTYVGGTYVVYAPGSSSVSNSTTFSASYDLVVQGYTMPVTYTLSGTWSTYYDSYYASPYVSYYCP